jgi:hypothetical protein
VVSVSQIFSFVSQTDIGTVFGQFRGKTLVPTSPVPVHLSIATMSVRSARLRYSVMQRDLVKKETPRVNSFK